MTSRRTVLAALPALCVAGTAPLKAQAQAQERRDPALVSWEYNPLAISAWWWTIKKAEGEIAELTEREFSYILDGLGYLKKQGEQGWSVAAVRPGPPTLNSDGSPHENLMVLLKRPRNERQRVVWEFNIFRPTNNPGDPRVQIDALGRQGWEVYYTSSFFVGPPDLIHAQRMVVKTDTTDTK